MFVHSMVRNELLSASGERIALLISGDDTRSKEIVAELIDSVGFDHADIGSIGESWRQEPGSPLYCTDLTKEEILFWCSKT